jgi:hypothetical protein
MKFSQHCCWFKSLGMWHCWVSSHSGSGNARRTAWLWRWKHYDPWKMPWNICPMTQHLVPQDLNLQHFVSNNPHIRLQLMQWTTTEGCVRHYNNARFPVTWYDALVVKKILDLLHLMCSEAAEVPSTFIFAVLLLPHLLSFFGEKEVLRNAWQYKKYINCAMLKDSRCIKMSWRHLTYEKQVTIEVKRVDTVTTACIAPTTSKALGNAWDFWIFSHFKINTKSMWMTSTYRY